MGKIFSINTDEYFFYTLVEHILLSYKETELSELKIILPYKSDILALLNAFKNYDTKKCIILPEIISLENIDEEDLILNLDKIKVINPIKRILLLIEFILKWNEKNNDNFSIDLAYDLASLLNTIQTFNVTDNIGDDSRKTDDFIELLRKNWSKTLKEIGVIDILEHKNNYINNMIVSLKENQHVIYVGIGRNENCKSLIKRIYNLPNGQIILPNVNFKIREKDWQKLDKKHYQYCLKDLLSYLKINRNDVHSLSKKSDQIIDEIFDTTSDLSKVKNQNNCSNIEIITCDSVEEEAQVISLIARNEGLKDVSLFTNNQLLATRLACLLKQDNIENYQYIMLLLYSINTLTSSWNSIELLSLLKHSLITFNYTKEKYNKIISEFEIEILRNFNINDLQKIIYMINKNKKIKYKEDIIYIINTLQVIFNPLLNIINHSIYKIATTHLKCIEMLSGSHLNNEVRNYMSNFINACKDVNFECSLDLYSKILTLFLKKNFFSKINKFSLHKTSTIIVADFNESLNFQNPFLCSLMNEIPSIQEEQGYFLYTLYNLFCAHKVYITRSINQRKSIFLQRIEMFFQEQQPYREWIKILHKPEYVLQCKQPMPKPSSEARRNKMQEISCSAVEKLIRNPYSFYVEYILNLKKLRNLNSKPSILEFGIMVHSIFEKYLQNTCNDCMEIAKNEFFSSKFNFSSMWWVRLQKIVKSFIELNKIRSKYIEVEKKFSFPALKEILITAKCDRVEYLSGDQIVIIDYKFGTIPSHDEVMSGFFPQLILQALAVEYITRKETLELAYWKFDYDQIKITSLEKYKEKMREFQDIIPTFLSKYLNEDTAFIASPYWYQFLKFNNYTHLERLKEWL